jgi:hypothetical protein
MGLTMKEKQAAFFEAWRDSLSPPALRPNFLPSVQEPAFAGETTGRALQAGRHKPGPPGYQRRQTRPFPEKTQPRPRPRLCRPRSPYRRLLASPGQARAGLTRRYERHNPLLLRQGLHRTVQALVGLNRRKPLMRQQSLATAAPEYP